jgi:hypothetical protein
MYHKKTLFRMPVILLFVFFCLAPWCCCTSQDVQAVPNPPKAAEPDESYKPGLVTLDDANTAQIKDVNAVEEPNDSPQPASEPQPSQGPTEEPNQPPDDTPSDANDKKPEKAVESSGDTFNKNFETIFSEYVDKRGMVNYDKLHRYNLEMKALFAQLASLDSKEYNSWTKNEKTAFWINTFNLKMLDIISDNYPIESKRFNRLWWPPNSIRHILPRGIVGTPKWNDYKFIVMDEEFTLSEIENRFLRKDLDDPRVFLALTLASLDSPPLPDKPYYGAQLDKQLDEQVKRFLSTPSGIKINRKKGTVELSTLFEPKRPWYGMEFLPKFGTDKKFKSQTPAIAAILNFICGYLDQHEVAYLETGNYTVSFKAYDWRVNEQ